MIAIDYDGTWATDPALWECVVDLAIARGHPVVCVTGRYPHEPVPKDVSDRVPVVYAGSRYKTDALRAKLGVDSNVIWIDDEPGHIEPPKKLQWEVV